MKHIVYRTTCLSTGRYYIGMHSTEDINDGYIGSGVLLRRSVKKHGMHTHQRVVLSEHATRKQAADHEKQLITWDLIKADKLCMNMAPGGEGGDLLSQHPNRDAIYDRMDRSGVANGMFGKHHSEASRQLMSANRSGTDAWNSGRSCSEEERLKISAGTKTAMHEPEAWKRFMAAVEKRVAENTGKITIWKNGRKKIILPSNYTQDLIDDGWVRSKAASISDLP